MVKKGQYLKKHLEMTLVLHKGYQQEMKSTYIHILGIILEIMQKMRSTGAFSNVYFFFTYIFALFWATSDL